MTRPHVRTDREQGQTVVISALFFMVLLGFLAVVIDGGMYLSQRRDMQGDADAAAMAAVVDLPRSQSAAVNTARDYVENLNDDGARIAATTITDGGSTIRVGVTTTGNSSFGELLGFDSPPIGASATARVQMMGPRRGMLPLAFMRDSFELGENYPVKFGTNATGNRGAIAPNIEPTCNEARGASDFSALIRGTYASGGEVACPTPIAETLDTEPGNMAGQVRAGFADRLGGDSYSFEELFQYDAATDTWRITHPESPRVGIVPVVEHSNGSNEWPTGRSQPIRILSYMLVYIGDRSNPPSYPATTDGKEVFVTPVRAMLPDEMADGPMVPYAPGSMAPLSFRLID